MKKTGVIFIFFTLLISGRVVAQTKDSVHVRRVVDSGTKGDLIIGKENKKKQLNSSPVLLEQKDSIHREASTQPKKKKSKSKSRKDKK